MSNNPHVPLDPRGDGQPPRSMREAVTHAIGGATACWDNLKGAGIFQSEWAMEICEALIAYIDDNPQLGTITNAELEHELSVRRELGHTEPQYRTIDSE